jgi:hypothetical protein
VGAAAFGVATWLGFPRAGGVLGAWLGAGVVVLEVWLGVGLLGRAYDALDPTNA